MKQTSDEAIFEFSGIEVISYAFYGAVPFVDGESLKGYLKDVEKIIKDSL